MYSRKQLTSYGVSNLLCLNALSDFPVPSLFLKFYLLGRKTGNEKRSMIYGLLIEILLVKGNLKIAYFHFPI